MSPLCTLAILSMASTTGWGVGTKITSGSRKGLVCYAFPAADRHSTKARLKIALANRIPFFFQKTSYFIRSESEFNRGRAQRAGYDTSRSHA